jgi:hypothetical protein
MCWTSANVVCFYKDTRTYYLIPYHMWIRIFESDFCIHIQKTANQKFVYAKGKMFWLSEFGVMKQKFYQKEKGQKDKQQSTKHYSENKRSSNMCVAKNWRERNSW